MWYMYDDRCQIAVAHSFVPSGTEAIIASRKVCYNKSKRAHFYKVEIPSLDYQVENNWVDAKCVVRSGSQ